MPKAPFVISNNSDEKLSNNMLLSKKLKLSNNSYLWLHKKAFLTRCLHKQHTPLEIPTASAQEKSDTTTLLGPHSQMGKWEQLSVTERTQTDPPSYLASLGVSSVRLTITELTQ